MRDKILKRFVLADSTVSSARCLSAQVGATVTLSGEAAEASAALAGMASG